jgi:hypothetical protein
MEHVVEIRIPCDKDGFLSRECLSCRKRFKIKLRRDGTDALAHCPYCRFRPEEGWQAWLTEEQESYVDAIVKGHATDLLDRLVRDTLNGIEGFQVVAAPARAWHAPPEPVESEQPMSVFMSRCCRHPVKHDDSVESLHCIACGELARPKTEVQGPRKRRGRKAHRN